MRCITVEEGQPCNRCKKQNSPYAYIPSPSLTKGYHPSLTSLLSPSSTDAYSKNIDADVSLDPSASQSVFSIIIIRLPRSSLRLRYLLEGCLRRPRCFDDSRRVSTRPSRRQHSNNKPRPLRPPRSMRTASHFPNAVHLRSSIADARFVDPSIPSSSYACMNERT